MSKGTKATQGQPSDKFQVFFYGCSVNDTTVSNRSDLPRIIDCDPHPVRRRRAAGLPGGFGDRRREGQSHLQPAAAAARAAPKDHVRGGDRGRVVDRPAAPAARDGFVNQVLLIRIQIWGQILSN